MAQLRNKKLEASTLIEVLIAMVIIMVIFAIGMNVFNNVLASGVSFKKIQVQNELNVLSKAVKEKGYIENEGIQKDSIDYQFLTDASGIAGVSRLEIKASEHGKLLGSVKCLFNVKVKQDEEN